MFAQAIKIDLKTLLLLLGPCMLLSCQSSRYNKPSSTALEPRSFSQDEGWNRAGVIGASKDSAADTPSASDPSAMGQGPSAAENASSAGAMSLAPSQYSADIPSALEWDGGFMSTGSGGPVWPPVPNPVKPVPPPEVPLVEAEPPSSGGGIRLRFKGEPGELQGLVWKSAGPKSTSVKSGTEVWFKFKDTKAIKVYEAYYSFSASDLADLNSSETQHQMSIWINRVREVGTTKYIKVNEIKGRLSGVCVEGHIWYTSSSGPDGSPAKKMAMYTLLSL